MSTRSLNIVKDDMVCVDDAFEVIFICYIFCWVYCKQCNKCHAVPVKLNFGMLIIFDHLK